MNERRPVRFFIALDNPQLYQYRQCPRQQRDIATSDLHREMARRIANKDAALQLVIRKAQQPEPDAKLIIGQRFQLGIRPRLSMQPEPSEGGIHRAHSSGVRAPFALLQERHAVRRLAREFSPPRD
jgi:hypothetical protein